MNRLHTRKLSLIFIALSFFCLGRSAPSQADGIYYSFPSQRLYYYPTYPWYRFWYEPQPFRHKKHPKGSYYSWKRNNFYYSKLSEEKMLAYKAVHGEGQTINPLDDPKFLNDVKVYSLPAEAQITTTPQKTESTSQTPVIHAPTITIESQNKIVK